jgi:hypothetical protein
LISLINTALREYMLKPVHPRIVEEALGISGQERIRFTKAGLLITSGNGSFRNGRQQIRFPLYSVKQIEELVGQPGVVAAWRVQLQPTR